MLKWVKKIKLGFKLLKEVGELIAVLKASTPTATKAFLDKLRKFWAGLLDDEEVGGKVKVVIKEAKDVINLLTELTE
jgi:hypothetical protein